MFPGVAGEFDIALGKAEGFGLIFEYPVFDPMDTWAVAEIAPSFGNLDAQRFEIARELAGFEWWDGDAAVFVMNEAVRTDLLIAGLFELAFER